MSDYTELCRTLAAEFARLLNEQSGGLAGVAEKLAEEAKLIATMGAELAFEPEAPSFAAIPAAVQAVRTDHIEPIYDHVSEAARDTASRYGQGQAHWHELLDAIHAALGRSSDALNGAGSAHAALEQEAANALDAVGAGLAQAFVQARQVVLAGATATAPEIGAALASDFAASDTALHALLVETLPAAVDTSAASFENLTREFQQVRETLAASYSRAVSETTDALCRHAEQVLGEALQGLGTDLVNVVVEQVGAKIVEAGVEAQLSVALSTGLAPIMPELLAIYKGLDALEEAIALFHKLERPFG